MVEAYAGLGVWFGSLQTQRFPRRRFRLRSSPLYLFQKYNIRYFLYNGGNDSMDTCAKISEYMSQVDYECRIIGVPKTIDNDLPFTDHTPGYGSAAKYIANTLMEISYDMLAYRKGKVTIVEIMGRHAGWLTAAGAIATKAGFGPDLIYLPEVPFSVERFKADVKRVYEQKKQCLVAVSEGIQNEDGVFIGSSSGLKDAFGHFQLGGVASKLVNLLMTDIGVSARSVELASTQRAASHLQSLTDVNEAIEVGRKGSTVRACRRNRRDGHDHSRRRYALPRRLRERNVEKRREQRKNLAARMDQRRRQRHHRCVLDVCPSLDRRRKHACVCQWRSIVHASEIKRAIRQRMAFSLGRLAEKPLRIRCRFGILISRFLRKFWVCLC
ncbi:MAG: diphosphate--fructose-6-phosphate 1-phosphotransferase [Bacillus subtilis]|nr:diphosphate--fructose-6-phosphate 1-phosphotransferase [Bacillus subtilis]